MDLPRLRGDQNFWDVWLEIDFGCRRYHRVLRTSGDSHLDRGRFTGAFYLRECFEPSGRERVVKISSRLCHLQADGRRETTKQDQDPSIHECVNQIAGMLAA